MSTVALQMIIKDERDDVNRIVAAAIDYFDEINLTISDKTTANFVAKVAKATPKVHVQYREPQSSQASKEEWQRVRHELIPEFAKDYHSWEKHINAQPPIFRFDAARNANLKMCTADYFFWLDADDEFDFAAIPQLVEIADENSIDAIFLPYNYAQNETGGCVTRHWRERLIRRDSGFEWRGWVHETCISDQPYVSHKVDFEVKHSCSPAHAAESVERNHNILEKAFAATKDPRYMHYLGMSYFTLGDYARACKMLIGYLEVGGSIEDSYRALATISEAAYHLEKHDLALEYATKCATLKPEYPMAYWLLAQYEADQNNWAEALEWIRVSETKPNPETLSVWDPSARERAVLIAAQAEFMLGHHNAALAWLRKIPKNKTALTLFEDFQKEADAETFINLLPKMRKFFATNTKLWGALCHDIKYDERIRPFRQEVVKPKTWGDKSIVIFCGQGYEEWGPHTIDRGMGGSEEAIVYLAPELVKLGYDVTVYGEASVTQDVDLPYKVAKDKGISVGQVNYRPWKEIDTRDEFNIFVAWRAPQYLEKINAKVKLADIHDVLPAAMMVDHPDTAYLVKSAYHRSLYPALPDEKFHIIGNGIKKEQFHVG